MIKEHLTKSGELDMRFAENQHYEARNLKRGILGAIILAFLLACAGMTFIMRPRSARENIFEDIPNDIELVPTISPIVPLENTDIGMTKQVVRIVYATDGYTYTAHANKPYYNDIIAELRMRYVNWQDAAELVAKESGFNPFAINPTSGACGLTQALPCAKMGCDLADINCQLDWQWDYIAGRYGTVSKALQFWYAQEAKNGKGKGWY